MLITLRAQRVKPYCPWVFFFKLRVPDTDDVKKKTSLFSFQEKNLLAIVLWFLFFCFTSSVSSTRSRCPSMNVGFRTEKLLQNPFPLQHI